MTRELCRYRQAQLSPRKNSIAIIGVRCGARCLSIVWIIAVIFVLTAKCVAASPLEWLSGQAGSFSGRETDLPADEARLICEFLESNIRSNFEKIRTWSSDYKIHFEQKLSKSFVANAFGTRLPTGESGELIQHFDFVLH